MTPQNLFTIVYGDSGRIVQAISTGSAWEIWFQVEMVLITRAAGYNSAREVPYPDSAQRLDLLVQDKTVGNYAIEIKVESANTAGGTALVTQLQRDMQKITSFNMTGLVARWVLGVGYSADACRALKSFADADPRNRLFHLQDSLGVILIAVS